MTLEEAIRRLTLIIDAAYENGNIIAEEHYNHSLWGESELDFLEEKILSALDDGKINASHIGIGLLEELATLR